MAATGELHADEQPCRATPQDDNSAHAGMVRVWLPGVNMVLYGTRPGSEASARGARLKRKRGSGASIISADSAFGPRK